MALSYNTGATASADTSASVNLSIPSGVLTGDLMLMSLTVFTEDSSAPSVAFSGAGGTWTAVTTTDSSANPQTATPTVNSGAKQLQPGNNFNPAAAPTQQPFGGV